MKKTVKITKKEQSRSTISRLLRVAMQEFSEKGYSGASTERIVKNAEVTRGALYHHFKNKQDLFLAVFRMAQEDIGKKIEQAAEQADHPWDELVFGCYGFLEASSDPVLQQIVVIDAPWVLDWNSYREVDNPRPETGLSLLQECLEDLLSKKIIEPLPIDALTHLLSGAMDEAAVWVAQSDNPKEALNNAKIALKKLLEGIKS